MKKCILSLALVLSMIVAMLVFLAPLAAFAATESDLRSSVQTEYGQWAMVPADERILPTNMKVPFRIMWLIYTDGVLNEKQYKMTDSCKYLILDTMKEFEGFVETSTNNNVDIINEYKFIDRQIDISNTDTSVNGFYSISPEVAQQEITYYAPTNTYNFVMTVAQIPTNLNGSDYSAGMCYDSIINGQGYATLYISEKNKSPVSIIAHEFLHAFEFNRVSNDFLPEIIMPWLHVLPGDDPVGLKITGFEEYNSGGKFLSEAYNSDGDSVPYMRAFLQANIKYIDPATKEMKYVGMFPSMWKYVVGWQSYCSIRDDKSAIEIVVSDFSLEIPNSFFANRTNLVNITISDGVTSIGESVFSGCESLTNIAIPESVMNIGSQTFANCKNLKSINIPSGIKTIEINAFYGCNALTEITIPGTVEWLRYGAFQQCKGLTKVTLSPGVQDLDSLAFAGCSNLTTVVVPDTVTFMRENSAFQDCPKLTMYGSAGSYAESYAKANNIKFVAGSPDGTVQAFTYDTASTWAADGLKSATAKGFVPSDLQGKYTEVITRAEFCRLAVKWLEYKTGKSIDTLLAEKNVSRTSGIFSDTNDPDILAAYALGITNGTGNGQFSPNGSFTREQAAGMIRNVCRAAGMDVSNVKSAGFSDANTMSTWAVDGINFCYNNKIMTGTNVSPLTFSPKMNYTREQSILTFDNIK